MLLYQKWKSNFKSHGPHTWGYWVWLSLSSASRKKKNKTKHTHKEGRVFAEGHSGVIRVLLGYIHSASLCNSSVNRSSLCTPSASWLSERLSAGGNWARARRLSHSLSLSLSRVHRSHTAAGNDTLKWVTSAAVSHPVIGESSVLLGRGAPCTPAPKYTGKFWNHSVSLHPPHPFGP